VRRAGRSVGSPPRRSKTRQRRSVPSLSVVGGQLFAEDLVRQALCFGVRSQLFDGSEQFLNVLLALALQHAADEPADRIACSRIAQLAGGGRIRPGWGRRPYCPSEPPCEPDNSGLRAPWGRSHFTSVSRRPRSSGQAPGQAYGRKCGPGCAPARDRSCGGVRFRAPRSGRCSRLS